MSFKEGWSFFDIRGQNYDLSLDKLKHAINIPDETKLILSDSLDGEKNSQQNRALAFSGMESRTDIRQLEIEQTGNKYHWP